MKEGTCLIQLAVDCNRVRLGLGEKAKWSLHGRNRSARPTLTHNSTVQYDSKWISAADQEWPNEENRTRSVMDSLCHVQKAGFQEVNKAVIVGRLSFYWPISYQKVHLNWAATGKYDFLSHFLLLPWWEGYCKQTNRSHQWLLMPWQSDWEMLSTIGVTMHDYWKLQETSTHTSSVREHTKVMQLQFFHMLDIKTIAFNSFIVQLSLRINRTNQF